MAVCNLRHKFLNDVRYFEYSSRPGQPPARAAARPARERGGLASSVGAGPWVMPETIEVASRNRRLNCGNCFSKRSIGEAISSPAVTLPSALKIGPATPAAPG